MRSGRVSRLAPAAAIVLALACGPRDAPDDQLLTSPHFRYHARADAVLDPIVMDRLEAFRGELDATFGIESPIVDYYLYRDVADLSANSPCPGRPCTYAGTEIQTSAPFHEHELVHALLSDVGRPASVVAEGIANHFACAQPRLSYEIDPAKWATAVGADTTGEVDFAVASTYSFGQRLVAWMLETGGTRRFLDFYGTSLDTKDAAIFALQFQRFWNRRLPDVAEELFDRRFQGSSCPCGAPAVPTDGSTFSLVALEEYRTLDVAAEGRLVLDNDGPQILTPYQCANGIVPGPYVYEDVATRPSRTVARVGPGRYALTTSYMSTGTAHAHLVEQVAQDDWSCEAAAAHPIALDGREVSVWVDAERADQNTWFAFDLPVPLGTVDILTTATRYVICPSCTSNAADCASFESTGTLSGVPVTVAPGKPLMVMIAADWRLPRASVGARVRTLR